MVLSQVPPLTYSGQFVHSTSEIKMSSFSETNKPRGFLDVCQELLRIIEENKKIHIFTMVGWHIFYIQNYKYFSPLLSEKYLT